MLCTIIYLLYKRRILKIKKMLEEIPNHGINLETRVRDLSLWQKFDLFNEDIYSIYKTKRLTDLSEARFDEGKTCGILFDVLRQKQILHKFEYSDFEILDELIFITKDLKYITGLLYFFRPGIVNPLSDEGRYLQTLHDHRYLTFASLGFQLIYNYWDRLGDLLWRYFETDLEEKKVYFVAVMNKINQAYRNESYQVVMTLYDREIKHLLKTRNQVVHYCQLEAKMYWGAVKYSGNNEKLQELQDEKEAYPDVFSLQLKHFNTAFELVMNLIDTLPDRPTPEGQSETVPDEP